MAHGKPIDRFVAALLDLGKALCLGIAISAGGFVLLFLIGMAFSASDGRVLNGLEVAKDGLLVVAAVGLFLLAGMLLKKGKEENRPPVAASWRNHFHVVGYKSVLAMFSICFAIFASVADYLLLIT